MLWFKKNLLWYETFKGWSRIYTGDPNFVIIVPADGLAPEGAWPTAGTMLMMKFDIFFLFLSWFSLDSSDSVLYSLTDNNIQNDDEIFLQGLGVKPEKKTIIWMQCN